MGNAVCEGTMTSSPSRIPSASRLRTSAAVPLEQPTACFVPVYALNSCSNASVSFPPMNHPESSTRRTALYSSGPMSASNMVMGAFMAVILTNCVFKVCVREKVFKARIGWLVYDGKACGECEH